MNDPFEQLLRSHRRLEERLADMRRAAADLGGPKDQMARDYLDESLAWIDRAVRRHEADEEASLFPRIQHVTTIHAAVDRLTHEHRAQETLARALAEALRTDATRVKALVEALAASYAAHVATEEGEVFPAARAALDARACEEMQREMDERRGR